MELIVRPVQMPDISFNFDELKEEITNIAGEYKASVAVDIETAKKDRARLNAFKKALNDRRIALSREYAAPIDRFKNQVDELIKIIDEPVNMIDKRIKDAEAAEKAAKAEKIREALSPAYEALTVNMEADSTRWQSFVNAANALYPKWTNKTVRMEAIQADIEGIVRTATQAFTELKQSDGTYYHDAYEEYLRTLDMKSAYSKLAQVRSTIERQKRREEEAKRREEWRKTAQDAPTAAESHANPNSGYSYGVGTQNAAGTKQEAAGGQQDAKWVTFKAYMTTEQAKALAAWFKENGIQYGKP
jgi:uncharacterized protein YdcH (DUF465 family)